MKCSAKQSGVVAALLLAATAATPAWATPKDDVQSAVTKLLDAKSYSYAVTVEGGGPGAGEGKVEKGGYSSMSITIRNAEVHLVRKGERLAVQGEDGTWKLAGELEGEKRPVRNAVNAARAIPAPAEDAAALLADAGDMKKGTDNTYTADLPADAAKKWVPMLRTPRASTAPAPQVKDGKATVTFTLVDGSLAKLSLHVSGVVTRGGNDRDVDRTLTTDFKDVDKTTADVPPEAKAKLEGGGTATRPTAG